MTGIEVLKAATERAKGAADARAEIERDGWTRDTASAYLRQVGPASGPYSAGYDAVVRDFADGRTL